MTAAPYLPVLLILAAGLPALAQPGAAPARTPSPLEIVQRSVELDNRNWEKARNYTYIERVQEKKLDHDGRVKSVETKTYDVTILYDEPYRKLIARDDHPLDPEEQKKEEAKADGVLKERQNETPEQRSKRLEKRAQRRNRQRELIRQVPQAYDFRLEREETVGGQKCWVITGTARPDFHPSNLEGRMLSKLQIRMWVAKDGYHWVRAEADLMDNVTFGLFLVRLNKGSHLEFEQAPVEDGLWMPVRQYFAFTGRLGMFLSGGGEQENTFSNYRKFQADAHITGMQAETPER